DGIPPGAAIRDDGNARLELLLVLRDAQIDHLTPSTPARCDAPPCWRYPILPALLRTRYPQPKKNPTKLTNSRATIARRGQKSRYGRGAADAAIRPSPTGRNATTRRRSKMPGRGSLPPGR